MAQEYPILANGILEVQIIGRIHGQVTRNVFHYYPVSATGMDNGRDEINQLLNSFNDSVVDAMLGCVSNEWKCENLMGQLIAPVRYRAIFKSIQTTGAVQAAALPSYCATVISRIGIRQGKKYQGRMYVPGVPTTYEQDSKINPALLGNYDALGLALTRRQDATVGPNLFAPTLKRSYAVPGDPADQEVVDYQVRDVLRVQRRREFGVGE